MRRFVAIGALALALGACAGPIDHRTQNGALLGGAGGAIIGGVASDSVGGALLGGVVGATAGAVVADLTRPQYYYHHRRHCHYSDDEGRTVCHRW